MEKCKSKQGFTLIEMLATVLILILLVMGIGVGMDAGSRIYQDATFESDSATLAGILNTNLGDILRYSTRVRFSGGSGVSNKLTEEECIALTGNNVIDPTDPAADGYSQFVFTSLDYGIQDAFFYTPQSATGSGFSGVLQMKNLRNESVVELVNSGAYPDLVISDFVIRFYPRKNPGVEGGYFDITYTIHSTTNPDKVRNVETIVRLMND